MNLLLIGIDNNLKNILVSSLLPKGYPVYYSDYDKESIKNIIQKKEINVVFIDTDKKGGLIEQLELIKIIRQMQVALIAYTEHVEEGEVKILIEHGVTAYIEKTEKTGNDIKRLIEIIFKNVPQKEKRKAVRVKVGQEDEVTVDFSIPNSNKVVRGDVLEISYLGLFFKVGNLYDTSSLKIGDVVSRLTIFINSKRAITDVQIVIIKGDFVGAKFLSHDDALKNLLIRYIHDKMMDTP